MGESTGISWTDHTFNPWWGCLKVSPGCTNCYAEHLAVHRRHKPIWGPASTTRRQMMSENYWKDPIKWNRKAAEEGVRRRVFCASMADVFEDHPDVYEPRARLWKLIEDTPALDWLLLTKRPENIETMLPFHWNDRAAFPDAGIPRNIWFGTSAENQELFDKRWPELETFAHNNNPAKTFLSLEPLLGPIDISSALVEIDLGDEDRTWWTRTVDWVIVGGESGSERRPMDLQWARDLRDQCAQAEVAFFFKQAGGFKGGTDILDGQVYHQWPGQMNPPMGDVRPEAELVKADETYQLRMFE